ncbi:isochorismatase family protein [Sarocladium implicatum]|nr:isochorismatase family protein [Sarocladium implicatum]
MRLPNFLLASSLATAASATGHSGFKFERLDKDDALLLVVDHQIGLYQLVNDFEPALYRHNMIAHAAIGQVFDIPVILTTSAEEGPNGRLPVEIAEMYPDAPIIRRHGEVNAWDNPDFRAAVRAAKKSQIILAGIVTDVCTTFLALSLREEGYSVFANVEASGTTTALVRDTANDRMAQAGVQMVSFFSIVMDLMRDWRHTPGAKELLPFLDKWFPANSYVARAHLDAQQRGEIQPGQNETAKCLLP